MTIQFIIEIQDHILSEGVIMFLLLSVFPKFSPVSLSFFVGYEFFLHRRMPRIMDKIITNPNTAQMIAKGAIPSSIQDSHSGLGLEIYV
jgi:hypothetical protein